MTPILMVATFLGLMTALCLVAGFIFITAFVLVICGLTLGDERRKG